jgi:hypothetical protein
LRNEILDFSFDYPLRVDEEAGPRHSLHYYLYSDALSWDAMRMDSRGVPRVWYRSTGAVYRPAYVAWYALVNLGHYLRGRGAHHLDVFLKQIDWLENQAVVRGDGSVVWLQNFDYWEDGILLRAPWVSANVQGMVISALVRGWRITRKRSLMDLLEHSTQVFEIAPPQGGVRCAVDGNVFYTEVPGGAVPGIMDGFMTSLLGLYDLFVETGDHRINHLFCEGVRGLKNLLPAWDYRHKWSWYGCRAYLSPPAYHCLNRLQLSIVASLSGESSLAQRAEDWDPSRFSVLDRCEIYAAFVMTKNFSRLRRRTWLQRPSSTDALQLPNESVA